MLCHVIRLCLHTLAAEWWRDTGDEDEVEECDERRRRRCIGEGERRRARVRGDEPRLSSVKVCAYECVRVCVPSRRRVGDTRRGDPLRFEPKDALFELSSVLRRDVVRAVGEGRLGRDGDWRPLNYSFVSFVFCVFLPREISFSISCASMTIVATASKWMNLINMKYGVRRSAWLLLYERSLPCGWQVFRLIARGGGHGRPTSAIEWLLTVPSRQCVALSTVVHGSAQAPVAVLLHSHDLCAMIKRYL